MKLKTPNLQTNLNLISAIILLIGLGSALLIYLTAEPESDGALGYEVVDGYVYPVAPENSKMYVRDLELYGGKEAVLANELRYWFAGLWRGKSLAFTVAFIAIVTSFGVLFFTNHLPSDLKSTDRDENDCHGKYFNP